MTANLKLHVWVNHNIDTEAKRLRYIAIRETNVVSR